jgi:hypothetical protein
MTRTSTVRYNAFSPLLALYRQHLLFLDMIVINMQSPILTFIRLTFACDDAYGTIIYIVHSFVSLSKHTYYTTIKDPNSDGAIKHVLPP